MRMAIVIVGLCVCTAAAAQDIVLPAEDPGIRQNAPQTGTDLVMKPVTVQGQNQLRGLVRGGGEEPRRPDLRGGRHAADLLQAGRQGRERPDGVRRRLPVMTHPATRSSGANRRGSRAGRRGRAGQGRA